MDSNIAIHETAFVTSTFRAYNEPLSEDPFAKLWRNKKTETWIARYLDEVSQEEPFTHCVRNRFFLETIKALFKKNKIEVVINFGCGFSMYPFLLDNSITNIEIDKPEIIAHKKAKIKNWQKLKLLPARNIHFIGVDFSKDYEENLFSTLQSLIKNKPGFILIEGVLFFLNRKVTIKLFDFFSAVQQKGSYIGSASFRENMNESTAYKKLLQFINEKVTKENISDFQTVEDAFYKTREGYKLVDEQDYFSLSPIYNNEIKLDKDLVLNESFYVLEKIK